MVIELIKLCNWSRKSNASRGSNVSQTKTVWILRHIGKMQTLRGKDWILSMTSSYSKTSVSPVHTNTINLRFQKSPLWRAFSKTSVFSDRKRRIRVDGRLKRRKKSPFSKISGYVWTGPYSVRFKSIALRMRCASWTKSLLLNIFSIGISWISFEEWLGVSKKCLAAVVGEDLSWGLSTVRRPVFERAFGYSNECTVTDGYYIESYKQEFWCCNLDEI